MCLPADFLSVNTHRARADRRVAAQNIFSQVSGAGCAGNPPAGAQCRFRTKRSTSRTLTSGAQIPNARSEDFAFGLRDAVDLGNDSHIRQGSVVRSQVLDLWAGGFDHDHAQASINVWSNSVNINCQFPRAEYLPRIFLPIGWASPSTAMTSE